MDSRAENGLTALHLAAIAGSLPCVQALVASGANMMLQTMDQGMNSTVNIAAGSSVLHAAVMSKAARLPLFRQCFRSAESGQCVLHRCPLDTPSLSPTYPSLTSLTPCLGAGLDLHSFTCCWHKHPPVSNLFVPCLDKMTCAITNQGVAVTSNTSKSHFFLLVTEDSQLCAGQ